MGESTQAEVERSVEEQEVPVTPAKRQMPGGYYYGTGRRKTSVARVRIKPGSGKVLVNGREVNRHFTVDRWRTGCVSPLKATKLQGKVDVWVNVRGGGVSSQAGAMMMGLARALVHFDPSTEGLLRSAGYLTRDSRMVERKKPGQPGARKRFQYSKR